MNRGRTFFLLLWIVGASLSLVAQTNSPVPPLPPVKSPVDIFRELLNQSPAERSKALADRPAASRQRLLEKLREYQGLPADERELRLRATELRWWLLPLMREQPTNRVARLNNVPSHLRQLIDERLTVWDLLPPPFQQSQLANEDVADLFTRVQGLTPQQREAILNGLPANRQKELQAGLERWTAMSPAERRETCQQFDRYFELGARDREKVLSSISDTERQQMERTLRSFDKLPREQRITCIRSFEKFVGMDAAERLQFLKNAERWEKMTPAERESWRKLVQRVPEFPPLPKNFGAPAGAPPPMPRNLPPATPPVVTNTGG